MKFVGGVNDGKEVPEDCLPEQRIEVPILTLRGLENQVYERREDHYRFIGQWRFKEDYILRAEKYSS